MITPLVKAGDIHGAWAIAEQLDLCRRAGIPQGHDRSATGRSGRSLWGQGHSLAVFAKRDGSRPRHPGNCKCFDCGGEFPGGPKPCLSYGARGRADGGHRQNSPCSEPTEQRVHCCATSRMHQQPGAQERAFEMIARIKEHRYQHIHTLMMCANSLTADTCSFLC